MSDISTYEIVVGWDNDPSLHPTGMALIRMVADPRQLRVLMDHVESKEGLRIDGIRRLDAMSAEDAVKEINDISIAALISRKPDFSKAKEPKKPVDEPVAPASPNQEVSKP